jgi:aminoglycoside phosphotransferase (APT) family kinase protein
LFRGPRSLGLARRVAEAAHKLHCARVPAERRHGIVDELRILHECFDKLRALKPQWTERIDRVAEACDLLGASTPEPQACGIHRDFYSAQVIVGRRRLYLIDFDLYCLGDPALDIGNFVGHLTEQSLRETGAPDAFAEAEQALEDRFIELAGETCRPAIRAYTTLTLARHLYLSTQLPGRASTTESLFALCEHRLGIAPVTPTETDVAGTRLMRVQ